MPVSLLFAPVSMALGKAVGKPPESGFAACMERADMAGGISASNYHFERKSRANRFPFTAFSPSFVLLPIDR